MEDTTEELKEWKLISCSWIKRLGIVRMSVLFNLIYRFSTTHIKISENYFIDMDKLILTFIGRDKRTTMATSILKGKNKVIGLTPSDHEI